MIFFFWGGGGGGKFHQTSPRRGIHPNQNLVAGFPEGMNFDPPKCPKNDSRFRNDRIMSLGWSVCLKFEKMVGGLYDFWSLVE